METEFADKLHAEQRRKLVELKVSLFKSVPCGDSWVLRSSSKNIQ